MVDPVRFAQADQPILGDRGSECVTGLLGRIVALVAGGVEVADDDEGQLGVQLA